MNMRQLAASTPVRLAAAAAAAVAFTLPTIAQTDGVNANEIYQQERADCMAGRTQQSQADCLYEARSALRDRRAGNTDLSPDMQSSTVAQADTGYSNNRADTYNSGNRADSYNSGTSADMNRDMNNNNNMNSDGTLAPRADRN